MQHWIKIKCMIKLSVFAVWFCLCYCTVVAGMKCPTTYREHQFCGWQFNNNCLYAMHIFICHRIAIYPYQCLKVLYYYAIAGLWRRKKPFGRLDIVHLFFGFLGMWWFVWPIEIKNWGTSHGFAYTSAWPFDTFLSWLVIYWCHISQTHRLSRTHTELKMQWLWFNQIVDGASAFIRAYRSHHLHCKALRSDAKNTFSVR